MLYILHVLNANIRSTWNESSQKLQRKSYQNKDFDFVWKSWTKKNNKKEVKRVSKRTNKKDVNKIENEYDDEQLSVADPSSDHESNKEEIKRSSPSLSKNDDKDEIFSHDYPEKSHTRIAIPLPFINKRKRRKVIIDPNLMYDDKMHAGWEISTILKTISSYDSEILQEEIENDYEIQDNSKNDHSVSDQMEVDIDQEDQDWSIIKIHKKNYSDKSEESESKTKVKMSSEYIQYEPEYARFLYEIVRFEFLQLESECEEEKDIKRK